MSVPYEVLATGSTGNAVVIDGAISRPLRRSVQGREASCKSSQACSADTLARRSLPKKHAPARPRSGPTGAPLRLLPLDGAASGGKAGVKPANIDLYDFDRRYSYGDFSVEPVPLVHDVPNRGYKLLLHSGKVLYATDTNNLHGISAPNFDLYLLEANYEDEEIQARIAEKKANGEFVYERRVLGTHLSKAKCDDFIYRDIGPTGEYVYLHGHVEEGKE